MLGRRLMDVGGQTRRPCCARLHGPPPSVSRLPHVPRGLPKRPARAAAGRVFAQQQVSAAAGAAHANKSSVWEATASLWDGVFPKRQQQQRAHLVRKVSAAELQSLLAAQAGCVPPLVVIFSATWCGPCKVMDARLQSLAKRLGPAAVQVVKLETDGPEEAQLATELRIHKLPTILFCGPGDGPAVRTQGLLPEQVLRDLIENKCQRLGTDLQRSLIW